MPTGYTADVADGNITTLKEFAYSCARGMGALVSMRDSPHNAPIPEKFEPSEYNRIELEKSQKQLSELNDASLDKLEEAANLYYLNELEYFNKRKARDAQTRKRYESMLKQVSDWKGSPEGIKSFMLEQLNESIKWDCPEDDVLYPDNPPVKMTAEEYYEFTRNKLAKSIAYHSEAYLKELERVKGRNDWLKQLRKSLGDA